jgi:hypothetical protein
MKTVVGGLLLITACAAVPPEEVPEAAGSGHTCNAEGLADLVGREATGAVGTEAVRRSGSRTLRWIRPGDAVTMDYRPDRLNVHLDARNRVERFACG